MAENNQVLTLDSYGDDFMTGACGDGRQVVMGLLCPELVAYFFDTDGKLIGDERRPWKTPPPRLPNDGPYKIYDDSFQSALAAQFAEWQSTIGFVAGPIRIRAFLDERHPVGITHWPSHFAELEAEDAVLDEEERAALIADRDEWIAEEKFVWWWAKDYWVDRDGNVEST